MPIESSTGMIILFYSSQFWVIVSSCTLTHHDLLQTHQTMGTNNVALFSFMGTKNNITHYPIDFETANLKQAS